jgi:hypothetical protein
MLRTSRVMACQVRYGGVDRTTKQLGFQATASHLGGDRAQAVNPG